MKPRTKEQKYLLEVMQKFPSLTERQIKYAQSHAFINGIVESRGRMVCGNCAHTWKPKNAAELGSAVCPHCKKKYDVRHHSAVYKEVEYFVVSKCVGDYQAFQFFQFRKKVKANKIEHWMGEVGTMFLDMTGHRTFFSRSRFPMCCYADAWSWDSDIELRRSDVLDKLGAGALWTKSVHPILKRNGWNGKLFQNDATHTPRYLLTNREFESLWKIGHKGICEAIMRWRYFDVRKEIQERVIRLSNRHGVVYKTMYEWNDRLDYVKDLIYLHRDWSNPTILFPADFQAEKMRINDLAEARRRQEQREREERAKMDEIERDKKKKEWIALYEMRFKNMCITKGALSIRPLITYEDFEKEHEVMHHCIRTYYGKLDTLLVSISFNEEKTETAEIDLKKYEVVQCRGVCNQPSELHKPIVKLLEDSMKIIKAYNERKFEKKTATIVTPNLPAVIYRMAI